MFDVTLVKHKEIFSGGNVDQLDFKVLYRRVLFVMSINNYFGAWNRGIPRATAS